MEYILKPSELQDLLDKSQATDQLAALIDIMYAIDMRMVGADKAAHYKTLVTQLSKSQGNSKAVNDVITYFKQLLNIL